MTKKYFGTDGIRGTVNSKNINGDMFFKFGLASGTYFKTQKKNKQIAIIAKDTRLSGYSLEPALVSGLTSAGMHVYTLGPLPTNGLAMLTKVMRANMGIMITASHNPYHDNGLKLFGPDGLKLSDKIEKRIENLIDKKIENSLSKPKELGRVKRLETGNRDYIKILKSNFSKDFNLRGLRIVIDCANGAGYKAGPELLKSLGAKVFSIGINPNGLNINKNCGSTFPNKIKSAVKKYKAHIGISLDGDADRIIMCDENGVIIDGDQIIAAIADRWKRKKMLRGGVIGTLMSNYGLEKFFKLRNIKFLRSDVGDRFVKEKMQKNNFNLGGEQSGHIILGKFATTGDGLLVTLEVLFSLRKGTKASNFFDTFKKTPQILENIEVKDKNIIKNIEIKNSIKTAEKLMKGQGRILVRSSGTESKIRVMGESENNELLYRCLKIISKKIKQIETKI
jgi:phosphoglucosamine mutase